MDEYRDEPVTDAERRLFDQTLDRVLETLPDWVHELLEEIPLVVDDGPSPRILDELGIDDPGGVCGLHTGVPIIERSVMHSGVVGDVIHIFREGILNLSTDHRGYVRPDRLHRQIRVTVLHEIGHHFGLDEAALAELGYG